MNTLNTAKALNTAKTLNTAKALSFALLVLFALGLVAVPAMAASEGSVNINDAEQSQLTLLPRVGPALAGRILEFRKENGKFSSTEDLMLVRGIGEKTMELLRPFITISGKTTLTTKVSVSRAQEVAAEPKQDAKKPQKKDEKKDDKKTDQG